jgi:hypothetical protein
MVILPKAEEDGLHTRALLEKFRSVGYGQVRLIEAMQKGYVKRTPVKKEERKVEVEVTLLKTTLRL